MKIYLDYIFLENLIVNAVIVIEAVVFTKSQVSNKRKIFIIILDTLLACIFVVYDFLNNYLCKMILSILILCILFKPKNVKEGIKKIICYYMLYFLYLGVIITLAIVLKFNLEVILYKILLYLISGAFFHFLCRDLWKIWKVKITSRDLYYTLEINGYKFKAFVDTGNTVKDIINSLDVIFVDEELKEQIITSANKKIVIYVTTIDGTNTKEGYIVNNVIVYKGKMKITQIDKIILSFSMNCSTSEKYSAILGYETYLEYLEGVIL